jgi:hypothetical protein
MATFPLLKTKAVAQYPAMRAVRFENQVLRFVDGAEQRYRDSAGPLHAWTIPLNELDETELTAIVDFFEINQGRFGNFSFVDPWDGHEYPNCSIECDGIEMMTADEMRCKTSLTIIENRGK